MPRQLVQQRMTLRDREWSFHASRAISAVAKLLVCACQSWNHANCLMNFFSNSLAK